MGRLPISYSVARESIHRRRLGRAVQNHPPLCRKKARRYGAVIGLSAGLIGPDGTSRTYSRSLQDTPVFLGCSDVDPHIGNAELLLHRIEVSGVHNFRSESSLLEITSG